MGNNSEEKSLSSHSEENGTLDSHYELLDNRSAEKEKGFNGHTMRKKVTPPDYNRARSFNGGAKVRDNYHYPATRTWGCKGFQHKGNRQWLKRDRKYKMHCERQKRKESIKCQSKSETGRDAPQ